LASRAAEAGRIAVAVAGAACAVALVLAYPSPAQLPPLPGTPPPPPADGDGSSKVRVATTETGAEIPETLPIRRQPGVGAKVAISLRPGDLPGLEPGDQLEVTAEVEVTTDCLQRNRASLECRGKAYRFNPRVGATLILASSEDATTGLPLSTRQEIVCRQKLPARQHHCYMALTPPPFQVTDEGALPCSSDCRVNLVMDASHRLARRGTVLLLGGNNRDGKIKQDKGSIDAVRIRPADPSQVPPPLPDGTDVTVTGERVTTGLSLDEPPRRSVVYSQRLEDLEEGDQLAVRAGMLTGIKRLRHNAKIGARIVLADGPQETVPSLEGVQVSGENGEITENNGYNCTQRTTPCATTKVGVLDVADGADEPLYANLVLSIGRVGGRAPGDNLVTVQEGGSLQVIRYPAEHKG
jgi:hypothetical protein